MKHALARRCSDCPKRTKAVCHLAFGVFWCIKSGDGDGCGNPLVKKPVERKMKRRYVQEELLNATMPLTDDDY